MARRSRKACGDEAEHQRATPHDRGRRLVANALLRDARLLREVVDGIAQLDAALGDPLLEVLDVLVQ
jgi:hypothetical protein